MSPTRFTTSQTSRGAHRRTSSLRHDMRWFALLTGLGAAASYVSINIPHTEVFIEGRWIFGFLGFALLHRWWMALLMACILALTGFHKVSLVIVFWGNMLYIVPIFLVIRFVYSTMLARLRHAVWFGVGWLVLVLLCYQTFVTPALWGVLAFLKGTPIWPGMVQGWRDQPWLFESVLVGIISALGLMVVRATADLRANQQELATTLYSIGDGVIATDIEGRIRRMNAMAEKLTGWTEADALRQPLCTVFRIVNDTSRQAVHSPVDRVLSEGIVVGLANHTVLMARDGVEYPIADSGAPIRDDYGDVSGVVLVFRDQTEERATQQQLEQQHERLLLALRNANMGIWEWNVTTNHVDWSDEHAGLFGLPLDHFGGAIDDVQRLIHPDDRERGMAMLRRTLETGTDFDHTYRIIRPDGSIRWMHSYGKLSCDAAGQPRRIVGTTRDITERKHAEEEIRTLNATLERRVVERTAQLATINAELQDFAYIVSHDLKAPLRGVNQLATWLVRDYEAVVDEQGKDMFRLLKSRVLRMTRLIDGVLKYSRIGRLDEEMEALNLQNIVRDVIESLAPPAHITVTIASEFPVVWGDYTRMMQVFQNLIGNAIQYNEKPRGQVTIRCENADDWWQISVADNGPGIAEQDFERIFKIFQTAHLQTEDGSTGVGLSVVKKIVEQSGGKVWLTSKLGVGSTFFFTLPKVVNFHDGKQNE